MFQILFGYFETGHNTQKAKVREFENIQTKRERMEVLDVVKP